MSTILSRLGLVVVYFGAGVLFYDLYEGWSLLDTCYYLTATITTVGYGDVTPQTDFARFVSFFFIIVGLVVVFTVISSVATKIIEDAEARALAVLHNEAEQHQVHWHRLPHSVKALLSFLVIFILLLIGTVFSISNDEFEGKWVNAFWYTLATLTTVG